MISVDEAIARVRGAFDLQISRALADYECILERHNYTPDEIARAKAVYSEELRLAADEQLATAREQMAAFAADADAGTVH